jgi:carboxypeptidase Taq
LRAGLLPLIEAIRERPEVDDGCLQGRFPEPAQQAFGERAIRAFGYDYTRGRQDKTAHPFMTKLGRGDVRITTRYRTDNLSDGLFSTLHEAGHAMYEQGIDDGLDGTPLYTGTTSGVHESQSRLWENLVGRSLPFWRHWYARSRPRSRRAWRRQRNFSSRDQQGRLSLIRTDADEVTTTCT